ncbi:MAG TPA: protein meaA, partial [Rhodobacteraceae bacterium]|nr:protein meaA [Paracoccaceae bacterium]
SLKEGARAELALIDSMGGAVEAIEYMKSRLVESNAARIGQIESGDMTVVGVNAYQSGEASPLTAGDDAIMTVDPKNEAE